MKLFSQNVVYAVVLFCSSLGALEIQEDAPDVVQSEQTVRAVKGEQGIPAVKEPEVAADVLLFRVCPQLIDAQEWYIFTGGPGTGKTCVIKELEARGFGVIEEAATTVIAQELAKGEKTPWSEPWFEVKVAEVMEMRQAAARQQNKNIVFLDRSPVDPITYILWYKKNLQQQAIKALDELMASGCFKQKVFLFQDLGFCENTEIRHENLTEADQIAQQLLKDYESLGFEVIKVPSASIKERADFILSCINKHETQNIQSIRVDVSALQQV